MDQNPPATAARRIHIPGPSYFPILASLGLLLMGVGMVMHGNEAIGAMSWIVVGTGIFLLTVSLFGWSLEPI